MIRVEESNIRDRFGRGESSCTQARTSLRQIFTLSIVGAEVVRRAKTNRSTREDRSRYRCELCIIYDDKAAKPWLGWSDRIEF